MDDDQLDRLEVEFIREGRGNSTLHPKVVDIDTFDEFGFTKGEHYRFDFDFFPSDLEALHDALGGVKWRDLDRSDQDDWPTTFAKSVPDYPLLGRICDIYEDAKFRAEEIRGLDEECQRLIQASGHERGAWAANKLRVACRKALSHKLGLILLCD